MQVFTESFFKLPEIEQIKDYKSVNTDSIVAGVFEEDIKDSALLRNLEKDFPDLIQSIQKRNFKGKVGKSVHLTANGKDIFIVGFGSKEEKKSWIKKENVRRASALGCINSRDNGAKSVLLLGFEGYEREAIEGALLGLYDFRFFKKEEGDENGDKQKRIEKIFLVSGNQVDIGFLKILCEAQNFARDIVNLPGNYINPSTLAEIASAVSEKYGLNCRIYDAEEIKRMGMEGVLAVGKGSSIPPKFVHIWWSPQNARDKIAFIGKAITFDSGGLSLKTPQAMVTMKADKSGSATVLGAMKVIGQIKPPVEVHGIFAACENMPSGTAQRPDDIIKTMGGKTVEVENTDAEGRLTLVDALHYAQQLGVTKIVDLATLTGACMVALGEYTAGAMGNSEDFIKFVCDIGNELGEKMWHLPFDRDLAEKLKSPYADLKNVGDSYGGAITAGMFMNEFVKKEVHWVHLDIAGPAFTRNKIGYFNQKGGTGYGVRTLVEIVRRIDEFRG